MIKKIIVIHFAFLVSLFIFSSSGYCFNIEHLDDDDLMYAQVENIFFVAESRIGDRGGFAQWEIILGPEMANFNWQNGLEVDFTLTYDRSADLVIYQVAYNELRHSFSMYMSNLTDLYIRTWAKKAGTSIIVYDLALDGTLLGDIASAIGPYMLDILHLMDANLEDGFVLTGKQKLTWGSTVPSGFDTLSAQFFGGGNIADTVPEPATMYMLGISIVGLFSFVRLKRKYNR